MLKALLAGAAVTLAIAATPAFAQTTIIKPLESGPIQMTPPVQMTPISPTVQEVVPSEPVTAAERAEVRREWNAMAREWEQRERSGIAPPQGSMAAPGSPPISSYGGYGSSAQLAPSPMSPPMASPLPTQGTGLQGSSQEVPQTVDRAQRSRDWQQMTREWEQRQRAGGAQPAAPGQPPLPYQR